MARMEIWFAFASAAKAPCCGAAGAEAGVHLLPHIRKVGPLGA